MPPLTPIQNRFWNRVNKKGPIPEDRKLGRCWIWTGALTRGGYGNVTMTVNGIKSNKRAHRVAWFLTYGEWPSVFVCHVCDTPDCVRPSHLFRGTAMENTHDMVRKGRHRNTPKHGEDHGSHKLTLEQVRGARIRHASGHMIKDIAKSFGVTPGTISHIINGRSWNGIL